MKQHCAWIACLLLLCGCSSHQAPTPRFTLSGEIAGLTGKVYLTLFEGKTPVRIDSTEATNGAFTFTGSVPLPILAAIETPQTPVVRFFLENTRMRLNGSADMPQEIAISGSATDSLYRTYSHEIDSVRTKLFSDSTVLAIPAIQDSLQKELFQHQLQFVRLHPQSVASAYILYRELSYYMSYQELFAALARFSPALHESVYVKLVHSMAQAQQTTAVGRPYVDFSIQNRDGRPVALSSIISEGKYVLLDFWASWCAPCRAEAPTLVGAYRNFAHKGFEIFAVSLDKNREAWIKGISELGLGGIQTSELKFWNSTPAELYGVRSIPSNILINPDGIIVARNLIGNDLYRKLAEIFYVPQKASSDTTLQSETEPIPSEIPEEEEPQKPL